VPGLPSTIGYLDWRHETLESLCKILLKKLEQEAMEPVAPDLLTLRTNVNTIAARLADWASSVAQKKKALLALGLSARQATSNQMKEYIASIVVRGLFDHVKQIRDLSAQILSEIGPLAINVILDQQLWKVPGRKHGYDIAKDIFVSMGVEAVPTLLENIDRDPYIITNVFSEMPFPYVKEACKDIFARQEFIGRYREEIVQKMRSYHDWDDTELKEILLQGLHHSDELVRILSAEWFAEDYPTEAESELQKLLDDATPVDRFYRGNGTCYGLTEKRPVSEYLRKALVKVAERRGEMSK